jgi:MFS family permease
VLSGGLAPMVGRLVDRVHPRYIAGIGLLLFPASLVWMSLVMTPQSAVWELLLPISLLGVANAFVWAPLSTTATRNLAIQNAGAGAGVYNTTRQVGAVLGSASIAVLMQSRLADTMPGAGDAAEAGTGPLPSFLHDAFATAMAQSMLLPAAVLVLGWVAALCFKTPRHLQPPAPAEAAAVDARV